MTSMTTPLHTFTSGTAVIGPQDVATLRHFAARVQRRGRQMFPAAVIHCAFERVLAEELKAVEDELFEDDQEPPPPHHAKEHKHD